MFNRIIKPLKSQSFFLFGARGTGKSTFIENFLKDKVYRFDLLNDETFDNLMLRPQLLESLCENKKYEWIVIDEVQRLPKLLNIVHRMIEKKKQKFALTGSSSRKLKRGSANMLAGRAFVNSLYPLTTLELAKKFDLQEALHWGTLPKLYSLNTDAEKKAYLKSYSLTYIKEEIQSEQIVRKLEPFREFLGVAPQSSGKIINYSTLGREVGVQVPTVQSYFQILEETYIGFLLPHYHKSVRKSQIVAPKFYFFDNGVKKALEFSLDSSPSPGTSTYGELFEAFLIQQIRALNDYFDKEYRLSYFHTKNDTEIDLVLSKGQKIILIEIKSTKRIDVVEVKKLSRLRSAFGPSAKVFYLSDDPHAQEIEGVQCLPWMNFLDEFHTL